MPSKTKEDVKEALGNIVSKKKKTVGHWKMRKYP
jgi:hypothetical protein